MPRLASDITALFAIAIEDTHVAHERFDVAQCINDNVLGTVRLEYFLDFLMVVKTGSGHGRIAILVFGMDVGAVG